MCNFECLLMYMTCKQPLGMNLDVGRSKLGFWGEKWFKPVKNYDELLTVRLSELEAICKRTTTVRISLQRNLLRSSEILSDNMPCFAFMRLFLTFLFWIGLWCKHESCRWLSYLCNGFGLTWKCFVDFELWWKHSK